MVKQHSICAALLLGASAVASAADYPQRPIRLIVPFAAGGGLEITARSIGQKLTEKRGQSIVIDNSNSSGRAIALYADAAGTNPTTNLLNASVVLDQKNTTGIAVPLYLAGLFMFCMFCHGELAKMRPSPRYLTLFYLMISLGGALGGMFVGLVAPRIFPTYYELGLGFVVLAVLATFTLRKQPFFAWMLPVALAGVCRYEKSRAKSATARGCAPRKP